jgi:histidinol dehydrogenase
MRVRVLKASSVEARRFIDMLTRRRDADDVGVDAAVAKIIADVRARGDRALCDLTAKFDRVKISPDSMRVTPGELQSALNQLPVADRAALELAATRIRDFHRHTVEKPFLFRDRTGMRLGQMVRPIERVGIYVPGGAGAYPSTVLMNAIPARIAGVGSIVMVSPPSRASDRASVMAAAAIAGVDEYYRVGGAQAVAALAYGTETITSVDKIVGPGNAYVQAAKRMVYGVVDIDKMAGPSEVVVIADSSAKPAWVAADLIAQAEHGSGDESAVLITDSAELARAAAEAIESATRALPRAKPIEAALSRRGAIIIVDEIGDAFDIANRIAPEHLELNLRNASKWLSRVTAAGAVFIGPLSPAPIGDYIAGPNHVLPTGGAARFASPLGAYDFQKRTSIIEASPAAVAHLGATVAQLARMEGFEGHARAMELRSAGSRRARKADGIKG